MFRQTALTSLNLEKLFDEAPNPYVLVDRDLVMVGMNVAYLAATMRKREDLLGRKMFDAFPSDPNSGPGRMLRTSLARVFETGKVDHIPLITYPIALPSGEMEERYWSATHTPIRDDDGKTAFILQHTVDVTEFHKLRQMAGTDWKVQTDILNRAGALSDQNLLLDEERYYLRSLLEQAPSFTAVLRGPDHIFDLANASYRRLVGRPEVVGRRVADILPEVVDQGFVTVLDAVYSSGDVFEARATKISLNRGPDGELEDCYLDFIFQPLKDKDGQTTGIFVQGHEVTEQKLAEDAARENDSRFRSLAQSVPNHAWSVKPDGTLEWCNDRVYEYTGLTQDDLIGQKLGGTIHPDDRSEVTQAWAEAQRTEHPLDVEVRLKRHDGQYRWHLTRAIPSRGADGTLLRWIGTNTDIEDQKNTEAQLEYLAEVLENRVEERTRELERTQEVLRQSQKMEAIGNLAGGIAHDFNNLLQVVTGNLQLLTKHVSGNDKAMKQLDNALTATMRGASLASQLLSFGRRQPLAPKVVNLGRLIRDMDHLIRRSIGEAIEIDTMVAGGLWNTQVDPTNVETALLNLAINARDAMQGQGKLTIEIGNAFLDDDYARRTAEVSAGQYVLLAVTDTGGGIPQDILDKVFDPFFTTKPEGKGTGLGLSMVYGFVKQSGGHIKIYSEVGSGTTVKIYLPRSLSDEDVLTATATTTVGGSETILVVEDDDAVRDTAVALLTDLGYKVLKSRDAASGLAIVESGVGFDLLFTDVVMPGRMKSTELARKVKERKPEIGVLFTSGYTENSIVHDGRLDTGVQFLNKPYTRDQLARKVRHVIDSAKTGRNEVSAPQAVQPVQNTPITVLLCEDDFLIRLSTTEILQDAGMIVLEAGSIAESLVEVDKIRPDILVADLHLPDGSGVDLANQLRQRFAMIPVIFATGDSRSPEANSLDFAEVLSKPYSHTALENAIRRLCRGGA
ncbi:PAS domain-containing protein [Rhizobium sp. CG5]|uniref:hybrid sensor histidine kinase/response regulator n=1 Tax=Rhizobium sp. CG5 TaxID=2726076 RepID=UPI002034060A|nr:PAS domain-containing protein [Rhizobium sp. CG5]MCM2476278.1 PAS domain-containing protein [Rhizobium sp. CG5]